MSKRPRSARHRPDPACGRAREPELITAENYDGCGCVMIPPPGQSISISTVVEAVAFALDIRDFPIRNEVAVLLDDDRQVVKMVADYTDRDTGLPMPGVITEIVTTPHRWAVHFVLQDERTASGPASRLEREQLDFLRGMWRVFSNHTAQPVELLDVFVCGTTGVRSLALTSADDQVWLRAGDGDDRGFDDAA